MTNTYNYTNNFKYNTTNNIYNYTTNNVTNNYTTNYYIQDNSTYISYYVVEEDTSTNVTFEAYYEIYFELPDGRNSYNLEKEDIWGQYFIYDYSKYQSVPEDDGKTLGLWHLDGNLKDSSYHGNTSGSAYSTTYKDANFEGGKYLSSNSNDFLELKLDKVSLPSSYTLEWIQYASDNEFRQFDIEYSPKILSDPAFPTVTDAYQVVNVKHKTFPYGTPSNSWNSNHYECEFDAYRYIDNKYIKNSGVFQAVGNSSYDIPRDSFVFCALVYNNGVYSFYKNGVKVLESSDINNTGILISGNKIRFYRIRREVSSTNRTVTPAYSGESEFVNDKAFKQSRIKDSYLISYYFPAQIFYDSGGELKKCIDNYRGHDNQGLVWVEGLYYDSSRRINYYDINCDTLIDEVRLSKGALYTGNYVPSTQPYTTNTVLVTPSNASENEIAFKTNYDLGNVRIGGVRPTYPATGDIFVNLSDNKVDSVQQYQENGWFNITGTIYQNGKWVDLKGYDMSVHMVQKPSEPENPDPDNPDSGNPDPDNPDPDNPDPDNPDPDNPDPDNPDGGGSIWDKLGKLLASLFKIIEKLISPLIDGIISLINMIMDAIGSLTNLSEGFSNFLKGTFVFIPDDILSIIGLGVMLTIFASIIKTFM